MLLLSKLKLTLLPVSNHTTKHLALPVSELCVKFVGFSLLETFSLCSLHCPPAPSPKLGAELISFRDELKRVQGEVT